ncbi:nuclear transport factor 2 family protein [Fluviicola taffensis]|uniref:SnoaL-like domain-containing protein n=1 Tax=Fluviicola taffensis (strain DSM 16823 / NCIMB 13979 / RW262) TaxID=755732 RepID=F2I9R0_FLUTR|nr:nuclear transport factor 2 family protein [Fluviicola taffensis]AEA43056.1 hypothetical protein Fluta_1058 [Fluviicola taffensis DSM 16823]
MTEAKKNQIITELAEALQDRDFSKFISYFEENAAFEIPFRANGGIILKGLPEIKKHFEQVATDSLTTLIRIEEVVTKCYHSDETVIVEYFTKGRVLSTGETFYIQSSIALVRFGESQITYYKDIPNTLGIAKKAGVLDQLAASWKEE